MTRSPQYPPHAWCIAGSRHYKGIESGGWVEAGMESVLKFLSEKDGWKVLKNQEQLTSAEELEEATELLQPRG